MSNEDRLREARAALHLAELVCAARTNDELRDLRNRVEELERIVYAYCDPFCMLNEDAKVADEIARRLAG